MYELSVQLICVARLDPGSRLQSHPRLCPWRTKILILMIMIVKHIMTGTILIMIIMIITMRI